jgi:lipoyl-dependent peroxiredoxin
MDKIKPLFTATAMATGGRNGHTEANDGSVKADLSVPKAMVGRVSRAPRHPNTSSRQAMPRASAARSTSSRSKSIRTPPRPKSSALCRSESVMGVVTPLAILLRVEDRILSHQDLEIIVKEAPEKICPYSHATRGTVEVTLEIAGA